MKKILPFFLCLFSINALTHGSHDPIIAFDDDEYEGHGHYIGSDGDCGDYDATAHTDGLIWERTFDSRASSKSYLWEFSFLPDGAYQVAVTVHDNLVPSADVTYAGHGYCMHSSCHSYVDLGNNGFIEEAVTFSRGKFYAVGSVHLPLPNDAYAVIRWEEWLNRTIASEEGTGEELIVIDPLIKGMDPDCPGSGGSCGGN